MVEQIPKKSRLLRIVLVVSLALNMAVIGVVAGFALKGGVMVGCSGLIYHIGPIGSALSRDDRRAIADTLRADPAFKRPRRGETPPAITAIITVLRSDTLAEEDLRAATALAGARIVALQAAAADAFVDRVMQMGLEQRQALADRLENIGSDRDRGSVDAVDVPLLATVRQGRCLLGGDLGSSRWCCGRMISRRRGRHRPGQTGCLSTLRTMATRDQRRRQPKRSP